MTTEAKHTPEPWDTGPKTKAGEVWIYAKNQPIAEPELQPSTLRNLGRNVVGLFRMRRRPQHEASSDAEYWEIMEANARRIVACVNKLAGWSIEDLEDKTIEAARWDTVPKKAEFRGGPLGEPDIIDID